MNDIYSVKGAFETDDSEISSVTKDMLRELSKKVRSRFLETIKALWYINERDFDGGMQFVIDTALPKSDGFGRLEQAAFLAMSIDTKTYGSVADAAFCDRHSFGDLVRQGLVFRVF